MTTDNTVAGPARTGPGHGKDLMSTTDTEQAAQAAAHIAEHYRPDVQISHDTEREPLAAEHIVMCLDKLHDFATTETAEVVEMPGIVDYLNEDGEEIWALLEAIADDPARLHAALMFTAAQTAALHRELMHLTQQGIGLIRLINTTGEKA